MKKLLFILTFGIAVLQSCDKEGSKPQPEGNFITAYTANERELKFIGNGENITNWAWDFGDGYQTNGQVVTHKYDSSGDFKVTLTAANDNGHKTYAKIVRVVDQIIQIKTSFGDMYMWLYDETPKHKANFLKLADEGFFTGTTFHRIINDFVIQGGDPNSKDGDRNNDGLGGPGYTIPAEININHGYGAVGAVRLSNWENPNRESNGSQFYIDVNPTGNWPLDKEYTVFGFIMKGMDIATRISEQPKDTRDRPMTDIQMQVSILEKTKAEIKADYGYTVK
jgi:cyclophilin family peptidyl-prolyl cis-trans isomerase